MLKTYQARFDEPFINYWTIQYVQAESREEAQEKFDKKAKEWGCKASKAILKTESIKGSGI